MCSLLLAINYEDKRKLCLRHNRLTLKNCRIDMINMWPKQPIYALSNQLSIDFGDVG